MDALLSFRWPQSVHLLPLPATAARAPTRKWLRRRATLIGACLACAAAFLAVAAQAMGAGAELMPFDIPAQPLKSALAQYDGIAALPVFYPSELTDGRVSSAVKGRYSREEALRLLLEGTGLALQPIAADAFVLAENGAGVQQGDSALPPPEAPSPAAARAYDGRVQSHIRDVLCANRGLALGSYRLALMLQIDDAGRVAQARLLDTTGDRQRDAAILAAVSSLPIGAAPAQPGKPFVLLVRPRSRTQPPACPALVP
jgi:hypothetical protein